MAYADMLDRLPPPTEGQQHPRSILDSDLGVMIWETPGWSPVPEPVATVEDEDMEGLTPPSWWHGDAEASQTFLGGVGVRLQDSD